MVSDFKKIIDFFECMSLDNKNYFVFKNEDSLKVCVQYEKNNFGKFWTIWFQNREIESKKNINSKDIPITIKEFKVDEILFIKEITNVLLFQCAFADEFIRQVTSLFGKESVHRVILDTQYFISDLSQTVESLLKKKDTQNKNDKVGLRVVK